ncbi:MAG: hypothetical protein DMD80_06090 [Candidatus Rokuibacteriota bacterium]|nr:MAG: hypothetical protein DMD80_06090 [Candidatus Rokubacteria bacterium]PYN19910.1 MAG: hypothetical protein DMD76_25260 [Candidatus Rokubacteria bacterium]
MKVLAAVLIVTAIWLVLASVREGRGSARAAVGGDAWMIEQHDSVVRLGHEAVIPAGHPLARLSTDLPDRRG